MPCSVSLLLVVGVHVAHADERVLVPAASSALVVAAMSSTGAWARDLLVAPAAHLVQLGSTSTSGGISAEHCSTAQSQRGVKAQPEGRLAGTRRPAGDAAQRALAR